LATRKGTLDTVGFIVKEKIESHLRVTAPFIDKVIRADGSARNFLGKDIQSEQGETDGINDAAFPLPILTKDVVLAREELQPGA
jgi:hypothetical protein